MSMYSQLIEDIDTVNSMPSHLIYLLAEDVVSRNPGLVHEYFEGDNEAFNIMQEEIMRKANYRTSRETVCSQLEKALNVCGYKY